ncbi:MAG: hypothetical protein JWQ43_2095 [Glaciihabitans sp.]|nr:hypothetical protein [Glaciihabitans sp.]
MAVRQLTTLGEFTKSNAALELGRNARFIRWVRTRDGWQSEILHGRYTGRAKKAWLVDIDGETQELLESDWAIYRD